MKRKSSKKKSNKEKAEKESRVDSANSREDLKIDWDAFINYFNSVLDFYKSPICRIERISKGYRARLQDIVNDNNTKTILATAVNKMAQSDFLNGRMQSKKYGVKFLASFTWLFGKDENLDRVVDGFYDNPPAYELTPQEIRQQQAEIREEEKERMLEEARDIERQIREEQRRRREEMYANAARGEELQRILAEIKLPQLRENEKI